MTDAEIVKYYDDLKDKQTAPGIIADLCACPKSKIIQILQRSGRAVNVRKSKNNGVYSFDTNRALELYHQGLNDKEIAIRLGKHHGTINKWRTSANLPANHTRAKKERPKMKKTSALERIEIILSAQDAGDSETVKALFADLTAFILRDSIIKNSAPGEQTGKRRSETNEN